MADKGNGDHDSDDLSDNGDDDPVDDDSSTNDATELQELMDWIKSGDIPFSHQYNDDFGSQNLPEDDEDGIEESFIEEC